MAGNSFGKIFKLTSFGESHGAGIGGVIDGCPAGIIINFDFIQQELNRRKPGQSKITTQRKEKDEVEFLSGIFEGKTTGTPIGFFIRNTNQKSKDYTHLKDKFRPSHADYTYQEKYGIRDYRGGGRASARETASRVVAGAIAKQVLIQKGIVITAYTKAVGTISLDKNKDSIDLGKVETNIVRCPNEEVANQMIAHIEQVRKEGDTTGGIVSCIVQNMPVGIGEPVFDRLEADLAKGMLSINAVKGFEIGSGFSGTTFRGSEHNDVFVVNNEQVKTLTNHSGGVQGGISNGENIEFNVAFKPVATIMQKQASINLNRETVQLEGKGRHDPCVVPRAVVIVEAMTAMVLLDFYLRNKAAKI
ncbi:MAG: chorismate synthase [Flavobacteriales bacterium]|jgi:chorismate synthase|nr:chorismate synthase [Flavobacteriales bacterium]